MSSLPRYFCAALAALMLNVLSSTVLAQQLSLVSTNAAGTASGNGSSTRPRASADGRYVVFTSLATNLTGISDTNNTWDVFVRDTVTGTTTLVSINAAGTASGNAGPYYYSNSGSYNPTISADGRFVAFDSYSSDLVANIDTNNTRDVFVRDLVAQTTTLVSINTTGTASANGDSSYPAINAEGRFVAFNSTATNLTSISDTAYSQDVFVRDLQTGTTSLVSVNSAGTASGNGSSGINYYSSELVAPSISNDGRFVAFLSGASNLTTISDTNNSTDAFVRDIVAGTTTLVSVNAAGTASGSLGSPYYSSYPNSVTISGDGRRAVFTSSQVDLVANDTNSSSDVFVRDLIAGTTSLVSLNAAGTASGNGSSSSVSITPDGRFVVFQSAANNLVANDQNSTTDIFVRDLVAQATTLVSVNAAGTRSGNNFSSNPAISADGRFVAFVSRADLISSGGSNYSYSNQVFVRDLAANITTQASYNSVGMVSGNSDSYAPVISADGRFVLFDSSASNLVASDFNSTSDVFAFTVNQNPPLTVSAGDAVVLENNSGTTNAVFTVRLSAASSQIVTVNYATGGGTATSGTDYQGVSGMLMFAPGETSQTIPVMVNGDLLDEADETFNLTLTSPDGALLGDAVSTALILDNDPLPVISIADVSVAEGDSGQVDAVFTLTLSAPSGRTVSVEYSTSNGTATSNSDYYQASYGTASFTAGATTATVRVIVRGDTLREGNETFFVNLTRPINATLSDNQVVGTIIDEATDTGLPALSIYDNSYSEGYQMSFTINMSAPVNQSVTVAYATADGTAMAGADYQPVSGTLTFAPGQTSQSIYVQTINDMAIEPNETFFVNLSNPTNATLADGQAVGTINNDDQAGEFRFSYPYGEYRVNESSGSATITVSRSSGSSGTVTVQYATSDGTATAGADYTAASGTLTFAEGVTQQSFTVPIIDDADLENSETIQLTLSNPTGGAVLGYFPTTTLTIVDNDASAGSVLISEFRFRGPTGTQDEFVELYNNTDVNITVGTTDGSSGWTLAALSESGAAASPRFTIPNGTVLPARSHYLAANKNNYGDSNQYSLGNYGGSGNAGENVSYQTFIAENSGIALFRTANQANFTIANRLDAVGFKDLTSEIADLYREGMGLTAATTLDVEHSYLRRLTNGRPQDTGDNEADFVLVSTTGEMFDGVQSVLGAPGPENLYSPIQRNAQVRATLVDPLQGAAHPNNRSRDSSAVSPNAPLGTLSIRRTYTNNTGKSITRLRFRIVDITTLNSPGYTPCSPGSTCSQADVRVLNSGDISLRRTDGNNITIRGLTLEQPPMQGKGGGLNSTLSAGTITTSTPLANGASISVQFLLGVQQGGNFRFLVNVEALP